MDGWTPSFFIQRHPLVRLDSLSPSLRSSLLHILQQFPWRLFLLLLRLTRQVLPGHEPFLIPRDTQTTARTSMGSTDQKRQMDGFHSIICNDCKIFRSLLMLPFFFSILSNGPAADERQQKRQIRVPRQRDMRLRQPHGARDSLSRIPSPPSPPPAPPSPHPPFSSLGRDSILFFSPLPLGASDVNVCFYLFPSISRVSIAMKRFFPCLLDEITTKGEAEE